MARIARNSRWNGKEGKRARIDFDSELARGLAAYEDTLGEWWVSRSRDRAHSGAYLRIAEYLRASLQRQPRLIVDYACGRGDLLVLLSSVFPESRLVGLDGSSFLLSLARRKFAHLRAGASTRATFIQTPLPCFNLTVVKADLALFVFPNMLETVEPPGGAHRRNRPAPTASTLEASELAIARSLSQGVDAGKSDRDDDPETIHAFLLQARRVSLNLRGLLRKGGLCVRVEYGRARRHELSEVDLLRVSFEEGSLDMRVDGKLPRQWFRVLASSFFGSRVIEDVDRQSGKSNGEPGGFLITVLRAI